MLNEERPCGIVQQVLEGERNPELQKTLNTKIAD